MTSTVGLFTRATELEAIQDLLPTGLDFFGGEAQAGGGLIVRNEVSGDTEAYIKGTSSYDADVTGNSVAD